MLGMMLLTPDVTVMVVGKMSCTKDVAMTVGVTVMVDVRSGGATLTGLLEVRCWLADDPGILWVRAWRVATYDDGC